MAEGGIRYYILFANYEQGMSLHDLLSQNGVKNRIAPAPRAIQGKLSCGMSLLIEPEDIDAAEICIRDNRAEYYDIVQLAGQIRPRRDKYC
ncbi:DUF3343 domain-containing protein [Cloacibacillus evryensis]|uniref:DUF3343 domain-containing protein n=1 Tax=Cloacibacillus evryensis TaxID=508460 RepID=A0AAW5K2D3_9BACT|nr:DUF3343 domain-containing protein [Cloacibacillus evryensis]MCQ4814041.1 DUF3343 domain-containing protein [Cloacibacillus evryensis]MEA5034913.1 DUF3343 domain-containing protein [Cloacibacillus evryensis]